METKLQIKTFFHKRGTVEGVDIASAFDHSSAYEERNREGKVVVPKGTYDPFAGHTLKSRVGGKSYFKRKLGGDPADAAVVVEEKMLPKDENSFGKLILSVQWPARVGREGCTGAKSDAAKATALPGPHKDLQLFGDQEEWKEIYVDATAFNVVTLHLPGFGWLVASCCPGTSAVPFSLAFPEAKEGDVFAAKELPEVQRKRVNIVKA